MSSKCRKSYDKSEKTLEEIENNAEQKPNKICRLEVAKLSFDITSAINKIVSDPKSVFSCSSDKDIYLKNRKKKLILKL